MTTYHVYVPMWRVRAFAPDDQTSEWLDLWSEYRAKVYQREGPRRDRLVVRIALEKEGGEAGRASHTMGAGR